MQLSTVIMAVPERAGMVARLLATLGAEDESAYGTPVVWDGPAGHRDGIWATARRAWEHPMPEGATHRLVLQDDAWLCPGFLRGMHEAIDARPADPLSAYVVGRGLRTAEAEGRRWATVTGMCWGVAHCLPDESRLGFLEATLDDRFWPRGHAPDDDDGRLRKWHVTRGEAVWCPLPPLAGHNGAPTQQRSGVGGTSRVTRLNPGPPFGLADTSDPWRLTEDDARRWWED